MQYNYKVPLRILHFYFCITLTPSNDPVTYICTRIFVRRPVFKQEIQGLQVFAFSVVTVNDEYPKPNLKKA